MVITTVFLNQSAGFWFQELPFLSSLVHRGQVWRIFTYALVQPPDIWLVVDYVMLVWFGREVERHLGRSAFLSLYAGIYLLPPLLLTLLGLWWPSQLVGGTGSFAVFVAFAVLYPNTPLIFNVLAKWAAVILAAVYSLMHIAYHSYALLIALWTSMGFAVLFIWHQQGRIELPRLRLWRRKPKLRVLPDLPAKKPVSVAKPAPTDSTMAEVDALLDKIAKSGIASLTPKERAKLDAARANLLKRSSRRE
jgi:membrane associated rhomboid family serine protease